MKPLLIVSILLFLLGIAALIVDAKVKKPIAKPIARVALGAVMVAFPICLGLYFGEAFVGADIDRAKQTGFLFGLLVDVCFFAILTRKGPKPLGVATLTALLIVGVFCIIFSVYLSKSYFVHLPDDSEPAALQIMLARLSVGA